jgi:hypothetical protein
VIEQQAMSAFSHKADVLIGRFRRSPLRCDRLMGSSGAFTVQ